MIPAISYPNSLIKPAQAASEIARNTLVYGGGGTADVECLQMDRRAGVRVTFEDQGGKTLVVLREAYPSKQALDAAGTGAADAMVETFDQLDELLVALGESSAR